MFTQHENTWSSEEVAVSSHWRHWKFVLRTSSIRISEDQTTTLETSAACVFYPFQFLGEIDELLGWFGETEEKILRSEPISIDPSDLRAQLQVSHVTVPSAICEK